MLFNYDLMEVLEIGQQDIWDLLHRLFSVMRFGAKQLKNEVVMNSDEKVDLGIGGWKYFTYEV